MYEKLTKIPEVYMIHARKNSKNTRICTIYDRKINKIPEFYMIFARKVPEFYIIIARKYFPDFFWGGGCTPRLLRLWF